ncbi:MAG: hypothetical protein P4N41_11375 [Negativicutes bacterium]|nr:hypothetical protein [Negativicutes bacterium]
MVDVPTSDSGRRDGRQPKHGPWGGKDADGLSNPQPTAVFPQERQVKAVAKPHPAKPDK